MIYLLFITSKQKGGNSRNLGFFLFSWLKIEICTCLITLQQPHHQVKLFSYVLMGFDVSARLTKMQPAVPFRIKFRFKPNLKKMTLSNQSYADLIRSLRESIDSEEKRGERQTENKLIQIREIMNEKKSWKTKTY